MSVTVKDRFCGAGGPGIGLHDAGLDGTVALHVDWPKFPGWDHGASDQGVITRIGSARVMRPDIVAGGYKRVRLSRNGRQRRFLVHRLVALVFLGPIPDGYQVNHRNGDRSDNRRATVEYTSPSDNVQHSFDHGVSLCAACRTIRVASWSHLDGAVRRA